MKLAIASLLLGISLAQDDTSPNFFVDIYENSTFYAYPMDICIQTGVLEFTYNTYTCLGDAMNGYVLQRSVYDETDTDCSGDATVTNFTSSDTGSNGEYEFNCGSFTSYSTIQICIPVGSTSAPSSCIQCVGFGATTYSIPGICHYGGNGTTETYRSFGCNATDAAINWYYNDTGSSCGTLDEQWTTKPHECTLFSTVDSPLGTLSVYSQLTKCEINDTDISFSPTTSPTPEPTTAPTESGASSIYYGVCLILSLVISLFLA